MQLSRKKKKDSHMQSWNHLKNMSEKLGTCSCLHVCQDVEKPWKMDRRSLAGVTLEGQVGGKWDILLFSLNFAQFLDVLWDRTKTFYLKKMSKPSNVEDKGVPLLWSRHSNMAVLWCRGFPFPTCQEAFRFPSSLSFRKVVVNTLLLFNLLWHPKVLHPGVLPQWG